MSTFSNGFIRSVICVEILRNCKARVYLCFETRPFFIWFLPASIFWERNDVLIEMVLEKKLIADFFVSLLVAIVVQNELFSLRILV